MLWVPAARLVDVVDSHAKPYCGRHGTWATRRLCELRSGRQKFVSLDTADKILAELDLVHFWHIPKDRGGLADIYGDGEQYGMPANHLAFVEQRPKYDTDEARLEARRKTWRESKRRRAA